MCIFFHLGSFIVVVFILAASFVHFRLSNQHIAVICVINFCLVIITRYLSDDGTQTTTTAKKFLMKERASKCLRSSILQVYRLCCLHSHHLSVLLCVCVCVYIYPKCPYFSMLPLLLLMFLFLSSVVASLGRFSSILLNGVYLNVCNSYTVYPSYTQKNTEKYPRTLYADKNIVIKKI